MTQRKVYKVVIVAYEGMTMLDAIGPNEVLANSPYFDVTWASTSQAPIKNDHGSFEMHDLVYFEEIKSCDIVLVPGGPGDHAAMQNEALLSWLREIDKQTLYTTSVCTGALILAKAGLLNGKKACTHWGCLDELEKLGALPQRKRFAVSGKFITSSGVSAGIDMGLHLVSILATKKHAGEIRFGIEYFPNQVHVVSTYTLPRFLLNKLSARFNKLYGKTRLMFLPK
jgi:putative intracellular protease/amidase